MEYLLSILYISLFIFLIFILKFFKIKGISRFALTGIFIFKVICGIGLVLIYTYYYKNRYSSDVYKYFDDSKIIYSALYDEPVDYLRMITGIDGDSKDLDKYYNAENYWYKLFNYHLYNDNRTIIRYNAIVMIFSFGHIGVHVVFSAFIAFLGLTAIFKTFYRALPAKKTGLILAVFFIPSVLFWTSSALKESLLMFPLGFLIFSTSHIAFGKIKRTHIFGIIISLLLLILLKFYILISILPGLCLLIWLAKTKQKKVFIKFIIVHIVLFIAAFNCDFIFGYDFLKILSWKQHDFIRMVLEEYEHVGSFISIPELQPTLFGLIKNTPQALFNVLFRPTVFEVYSIVVLLASLENFIISILLVLSIVFFTGKNLKNANIPLFCLCVSYTSILFILTGLTTPVLGALVRYKSPALPFLFIIFIYLIDYEKIIFALKRMKIIKSSRI